MLTPSDIPLPQAQLAAGAIQRLAGAPTDPLVHVSHVKTVDSLIQNPSPQSPEEPYPKGRPPD